MFDYLKSATEQEDYIISMRREFHRHPEVSNKEERTVARICEELDKIGIQYVNVPNGGVFAFLGDEKKGKTVLLRADIDALPIQESDVNAGGKKKVVVSEVPGVAHTCGHDNHAAMLLGVARALANRQDQINGRIVLMFERGEEGGGNLVYLHKWAFENKLHVDTSFGMHVFPFIDKGKICVFDDIAMAGAMGFRVEITGKAAHGSEPDNGISPIDCFVSMYSTIQSLRMKYASPFQPMVFSVGQVHAGAANNIIPSELSFGGSFRLYNYDDGLRVKKELEKTIVETAKMYNCTVKYELTGPSSGLVNDKTCSLFAKEAFKEAFGEKILVSHTPLMGSESHSLTAKIWPGTYMMLGIYDEEAGMTAMPHHECHDVPEEVLKLGTAAHMCYALEFLKDGPETDSRIYKGDIKEFYEKYSPRSLYAFE